MSAALAAVLCTAMVCCAVVVCYVRTLTVVRECLSVYVSPPSHLELLEAQAAIADLKERLEEQQAELDTMRTQSALRSL